MSLGDSSGEIFLLHVGGGYHFVDDLSLNLELLGGGIDIEEGSHGSASVFGADLLLRWHFYKNGDWTCYLDGGGGVQQSSETFPVVGTHFNFRPQLGVGVTCRVSEAVRLMGGVRWLHVSNSNRRGELRNPGFDAALIYAGLTMGF